jgi:uncharacterized protein
LEVPGQYAPTSERERLSSLDLIRGTALLGILLVNIQAFAMPAAALANPSSYGDLSGADFVVWAGSHLLAEQKFLTLFSLLFGAGVLLSAGRAEAAGVDSAPPHRRRMFWLMLFGIAHAYLLWYGDILFLYGVAGLAAYPLHRLSPRALLGVGLVLLSIPSLLTIAMGLSMPFWDATAIETFRAEWQPDAAAIAAEVDAYTGGWFEQLRQRVPQAFYLQTVVAVVWSLWRVLGFMLIGMALTKLGVFACREPGLCRRTLVVGLPISLALIGYGMWRNTQAAWSADYSPFFGSQYNYWGSMILAFAYMCLIISLEGRARPGRARRAVSAVGRTALSNYLLQSLICTLLFYGHGLGWYGQVSRAGQLLTVVGVWSVQLFVSSWWLTRFRQGPAEWLWRSLTYGSPQSIRRRA